MTRLAYFPAIYPGELLYSVLARYHRHTGAPSSIHTMEALFGRRLVVASLDLPGHLQVLAGQISAGTGWTAERIADELTLLPYYTAFQPSTVRRLARNAMLRGQTDGLMTRLGMAAFRVERITRLRFCSTCLLKMQALYGEFYWRRDHQLPGVLVCPDHGCSLQVSTVSLTVGGRHVYVAADRKTCPCDARVLVCDLDQEVISNLQRLAQASRSLLENPGPAKSHREWTQYYRQGVRRAGLAYSAHRVDQQRLQDQFHRHHTNVLAQLPEQLLSHGSCRNWLPAIVRKHRKAFHPLHHLLLQDFLDHQEEHSCPFGPGPWPCLNPLAEHKGRLKISRITLHRNRGHQVGVFQCDCGYAYTRSHVQGDKALGPPRFRNYGPMLAPTLSELVLRKHSLRAVARSLELDPKTVVRLAGELGIAMAWKARAEVKPQGQARFPGVSGRAKRSAKGKSVVARPRLDWGERDKQASKQIWSAAQEIRNQVPLIRVTTLQIERWCWNRGWLSKRAEKLPKTMRSLRAVVESVQEFQRRRVAWAIEEMAKADEPLRVWQILRKAGLPAQHAGLAKTSLDHYFNSARKLAA